MKKKERIQKIVVLLIAAAVIAFIIWNRIASDRKNLALRSELMAGTYELTDPYAENIAYNDYLTEHGGAPGTKGGSAVVSIPADSYTESEGSAPETLDEGNILTGDTGSVTWEAEIPESGFYTVSVRFYPAADSEKNIVRKLYINGEVPFAGAEALSFERRWVDEDKDYLMVNGSNQASPTQLQDPQWTVKLLESSDKSVEGPYMFWLEKGTNTLTLEAVSASLGISEIALAPAEKLPAYAEYLSAHEAERAVSADTLSEAAKAQAEEAGEQSGRAKAPAALSKGLITVQAEDAEAKSSSMLVVQNDRTSPLTVPYHASNIVMNTIGGSSWKDAGMGISWKFTVPESGMYRLAARFMQAENRDFYSVRELKINGEIPFAEAAALKFGYKNGFQTEFFGDENGPYEFYLEKGENLITLTVSLGDLAYAVEQTRISVKNFNALYRRLTAVMSSTPDEYRDYDIVSNVPEMVDVMKTEYYRLNTVMNSLGDTVEKSTKTREIAKLMLQLEDLIEKPDRISRQLSTFNDNITAISEWMLSLDEQPLQLDYLMLAGEGSSLPKAEGNFFQNLGHGFSAFVGSFTNDYKVRGTGSEKKDKKLQVWIATSTRDQYDILERLVERSFGDASYEVDLKMVGADTVMPATLTGNGPDVALQLNYTMPTNFAYRNAGYDLKQFDDFEEVAAWFAPAAVEYFEYEGGTYGLPDEMSFPVLYYRQDILDQLGFDVPETWEELEALLPYLQAENMKAYFTTTGYTLLGGYSSTSTKPVNAVYTSMLYQNGEKLYRDGGLRSNLDALESLLVFKKWTEYYTKQDFDVSISVVTRFRTGDAPVVIEDYTYTNNILAAAPEIDGQWSIAPIPGTIREDGSFDRSVAVTVGGSMILKNSVEANGTAEEAWDFLKWWVSEDTQLAYSREQQVIYGDSGNFPIANLAALRRLAEERGYGDTVNETIEWSRGIPQVPGGYISGRYVENAFLTVVNDYTDPVDTMFGMVRYVNQEIKNKRAEFGLSDVIPAETETKAAGSSAKAETAGASTEAAEAETAGETTEAAETETSEAVTEAAEAETAEATTEAAQTETAEAVTEATEAETELAADGTKEGQE